MATKPRVSPSTRVYMERKLAAVEHRRVDPPSAAAIARILADMQSPNEQTRAHAVEQLCPCRVPWDTFRQVRKAAQQLQNDPSPLVRANARHVEEDAREIEALEALREWIMEHEVDLAESSRRAKGRKRHRPRAYRERLRETTRR